MDAASDLWELAKQTIDYYAERDADLDEINQYYFLEYDKDDKETAQAEGIEIVRMPWGTGAIDLVQDLVTSADMTFTVAAPSEKKKGQQAADDAEQFLQAIWTQSQRTQHQRFLSKAAWLAGMRGAVCMRVLPSPGTDTKITVDEEGRATWEADRRIPLAIQVRDPRYVYPEIGIDGLSYVVEQSQRRVADIRRTLGDKEALPGKRPAEEVTWVEYWDDSQYCYWAAGELVSLKAGQGPWPHTYGQIPYAFEYARQTGSAVPEERARGLLHGVLNVIDRLDLADSAEATAVHQYTGDAWTVITEQEDFELDTRPGAVNHLYPGESVDPLRAGRQPMELDKMRAKYEAHFERGTFPSSMYGLDPGRIMAGYAINLLNQSGQIRLNGIIAALQACVESLGEVALRMCAEWLADLTPSNVIRFMRIDDMDGDTRSYRVANWLEFKPRDLDGLYHVEVQIGDLLPSDEQANMVLAGRAREPGTDGRPMLSWRTTVEKYGLVQAAEKEQARIEEEMKRAIEFEKELRKLAQAGEEPPAQPQPMQPPPMQPGMMQPPPGYGPMPPQQYPPGYGPQPIPPGAAMPVPPGMMQPPGYPGQGYPQPGQMEQQIPGAMPYPGGF